MTRPDDGARERRQRVSDETLRTASAREIDDLHPRLLALDLRDAREETTRLEAENAQLRAALATARRDTIEQAAKQADARVAIDTRLSESGQVPKADALLCILTGEGIAQSIRALAPDTAEGESDG